MQQFLKIFHFNYSIEGAFLRLFCLSFQIKTLKSSINFWYLLLRASILINKYLSKRLAKMINFVIDY